MADAGRMGQKQQIAPDLLDHAGVAPDQRGRQRPAEQLNDRVAAGADRIAIARADGAVGIGDAHDRRLLADKGLNGVDALHLGLQIHHADLDAFYRRHGVLPVSLVVGRRLLSPHHRARRLVDEIFLMRADHGFKHRRRAFEVIFEPRKRAFGIARVERVEDGAVF